VNTADANADLVQRYRDGVPDSVIVYNTPTRLYALMGADLGSTCRIRGRSSG